MKKIIFLLLAINALIVSGQNNYDLNKKRVDTQGTKPNNSQYYAYENKMIDYFKASEWKDEIISITEIYIELPKGESYWFARIKTKNSGGSFYVEYDPASPTFGVWFNVVEQLWPPKFAEYINNIKASANNKMNVWHETYNEGRQLIKQVYQPKLDSIYNLALAKYLNDSYVKEYYKQDYQINTFFYDSLGYYEKKQREAFPSYDDYISEMNGIYDGVNFDVIYDKNPITANKEFIDKKKPYLEKCCNDFNNYVKRRSIEIDSWLIEQKANLKIAQEKQENYKKAQEEQLKKENWASQQDIIVRDKINKITANLERNKKILKAKIKGASESQLKFYNTYLIPDKMIEANEPINKYINQITSNSYNDHKNISLEEKIKIIQYYLDNLTYWE